MKIKKIISQNLKEGKQKILEELGEDAVILSNRAIKDPKTGKDFIEIVAAIDESPLQKKSDFEKIRISPQKSSNESEDNKFIEIASQIFNEIVNLKSGISNIYEDMKFNYLSTYPDEFIRFHNYLIESEVDKELAREIISEIYKNYPGADFESIKIQFREYLRSNLEFGKIIEKGKKQQVIVLFGPSGSGKTMTLTKLAILAKLVYNSSVTILSADSYKVSGVEQLQTYSSIAAIPFYALYNLSEINNILAKEINTDFIFIDTIGKNHADIDNIAFIKQIIKQSDSSANYFVLPANLTKNNFMDYLEKYSELNPNGLIITKVDETKSFGQLLSVLIKQKLPLLYFSNGQQIPEDIEPISVENIVEYFYNKLEL